MQLIYISFNNKNIKIPVLMYHDFTEQLPNEDPFNFEYISTPERFEENIKTLLKNGYKSISFMQLYDAVNKKKKLPKKPFLVTFDDGYESQFSLIYPIIKKLHIYVTIFVVSDFVGNEVNGSKYFGWDSANEMQRSGLVKICSHGKRHIPYDTVPLSEFESDILESFEILNKNIGETTIKVFAYPFGIYNQDMVDVLKKDKIDIQANKLGMNYLNSIDLSLIARMNIPYSMAGEQIISNIENM